MSRSNFNIFFHFTLHNQIERLLLLREFCDSQENDKIIKQYLLTPDDWTKVVALKELIEPFKKYSVKLQAEHCTLSDFFGFWKLIEIKIRKCNHPLQQYILSEMQRRETILISNPVILGCIFLDPRYQRSLQPDQKRTAMLFLKSIYHRITSIQSNDQIDVGVVTNDGEKSNSFEELFEYFDSVEQTTNTNTQQSDDLSIEQIIENFDGKRESFKTSVLEYWEQNKNVTPELYKISQIIFAIPPTQSSVERTFSALRIILTSYRTNLADKCLQNILLINANKNIS